MENLLIEKPKNNDLLDLVKLILSFMIVAVHTKLFDPYLYPWLRLAVPLFFVISSYLFFSKINLCQNSSEKLTALKHFVLRNLKLYAFWFIVLFPICIFTRGWFNEGFWNGIIRIGINLVVGSTFVASWFIAALIIGTTIVFFASKKLSNKTLLIIGIVIHILVSFRSSYMFIFTEIDALYDVFIWVLDYEYYMNAPVNSFPAGILWIVCGKIFADGGIKIKIKPSAIILGVSCALLFTEWFLIKHYSGEGRNDVYIMLAPCVLALFNILIQLKPINLKHSREMRNISTIVYASHGTFAIVLNHLFEITVGPMPSIVTFLVTSIVCTGAAILVLMLKKYKYLKWLKYSH